MKTSFEIAVHLFCDCEDKISKCIYRTGGEAKLKVRVKYIKQEVSKGEFLTFLLFQLRLRSKMLLQITQAQAITATQFIKEIEIKSTSISTHIIVVLTFYFNK